MLVLTRRTDEAILIGKGAEVIIHVLNISENQVKIGITAPQEIPIYREEIFLRIQKEKLN